MMDKPSISYGIKNTLVPTVSLFGSLGTLVCCALPALLVSLGAGATLAGLVSAAPWLVSISKYKVFTFSISGVLIVLAGIMQIRSAKYPCPIDPVKAKACIRLRTFSLVLYGFSVLIWCVGFFFAFLAIHLL